MICSPYRRCHYVKFEMLNHFLRWLSILTQEDAEIVKECLRTLFVNDASSARPEGSMEGVRLYWWQRNCKDGQYSSKVHRRIHVTPKDTSGLPSCVDDYVITLDELPGLTPEVIDGV